MNENLREKALKIKLLILDVDGILTNGLIYYHDDGSQLKAFHIRDGIGIQLLQKAGIKVAIISGKKSQAVENRLKELKIEHRYLGFNDKHAPFEELKSIYQLDNHEIAYMGDDLPDLPHLKRVGLAFTVPEAPALIKQVAHVITDKKGGKGAVREACEWLLQAKNQYESVLESYFQTK